MKTATNPIDRAMMGAAGAPLSPEQKRDVARLARRAWDLAGQPGYADQAADVPAELRLSATEAFKLWRHDQARKGCGLASLRACTQKEFPALMAWFGHLCGWRNGERRWMAAQAGDGARRALAVLRREMAAAAGTIERPAEYVGAIARCKFKTADLETLSERQVWVLVFDIRRAGQARRKAAAKPTETKGGAACDDFPF